MGKGNKTELATYTVLSLIAASMVLWICLVAPWDTVKAADTVQIKVDSSVVEAEEAESGVTIEATPTPTPFVKKKANEENQGCIGDKGLVW
ncbi:MAG: hypothetical protein IJM34_05855 [Lachnospiraceae bacterium]|nr:hypothetical protein [Lachnospiraceae bacterium]